MRLRIIALAVLVAASAYAGDKTKQKSATALSMEKQGLVDVKDKADGIKVSLMYARADNFTGEILYTDLREAYLHPTAAIALAKAQRRLKELRPDLSLLVCDAARPMSIQQKMWDKVKSTSKDIYVSNPANGGGMHNYGLAVDITLCDKSGKRLDMGTDVDHMSSASHIDREGELVSKGRISKAARQNRELLRQVMEHGGFKPLRTEWWHFNLVSRQVARKYYKVIR